MLPGYRVQLGRVLGVGDIQLPGEELTDVLTGPVKYRCDDVTRSVTRQLGDEFTEVGLQHPNPLTF